MEIEWDLSYTFSVRRGCLLDLFTTQITDEIEAQAATFVKAGLKPMDALHLASASGTKADYFCTCDGKLLKKCKKLKSLDTKVVSPLELIAEVTS